MMFFIANAHQNDGDYGKGGDDTTYDTPLVSIWVGGGGVIGVVLSKMHKGTKWFITEEPENLADVI